MEYSDGGFKHKHGFHNNKDWFLALDSHDYPHIVYMGPSGEPAYDLSWTGKTWIIQTVKTNFTARSGLLYLALDSKDNPHISFEGPPSNP